MEFFFIAILTNTLQIFIESLFSYRWLYFEDTPKDIFRQYAIGFSFISIIPVINLIVYRIKGNCSLTALVVTYSAAIAIGTIKTFFDTFQFVKFILRGRT